MGTVKIEITDELKVKLDCYVNAHNDMVQNHPDSLAAVKEIITYSDVILRWYKDMRNGQVPLSNKDFGCIV